MVAGKVTINLIRFASMVKASWLQNLLYYLLCILAFTIPMPFIYSALSIIAISFIWLLQFNLKTTIANLKQRKELWPWFIFFILHAISYFYSNDKHQSLFDLQTKLSFVILPIIIGAGMTLSKEWLEKIFLFFVCSLSILSVYCISRAITIWFQTGHTDQFFYHALVHGLDANAVYQSWYALFSISMLLFFPWHNRFLTKRWLKYILLILQIIFFILLSSRTLIVIFLLLVLLYVRKIFITKKLSALQLTTTIVTICLLVTSLFATQNPIKERYIEILNKNLHAAWLKNYTNDNNEFSNLTLRIFLWRVAFENIQEHDLWWAGCGNGDVSELQNKKIEAYGLDPIRRGDLQNVNLHNMCFQSLIMLGIPGLTCFLFIIILPFFYLKHIKYKYLFFIFNFVSLLFMLQESAFQTQAGIIYYTFFSQVFWCFYFTNKDFNTIKST